MKSSIDFKRKYFEHAHQNRIPISCTIEIISDCNLRCNHCYIDEDIRKNRMSVEDFKSIVDQFKALGGLYLAITGGEVMLHRSFEEMYIYAYKKGLIVTVLTNGSAFRKSTIQVFKDYPPRRVEITLYGFSAESYKETTRYNVFNQVKKNIKNLINNNIKLLLKSFVMSTNVKDFPLIYDFAKNHDIPFKYDYVILSNRNDPRRKFQISISEIEEVEAYVDALEADVDEEWYRFLKKSNENLLLDCSAGKTSFWSART